MVESGSLENCCTFTGTVGSNPTLSANEDRDASHSAFVLLVVQGEVTEWPKVHDWKSCVPKGTAGSNPALSAKMFGPQRRLGREKC